MGCLLSIVCIICPPAAVIHKGCGAFLITTVLTITGWVPGVIAAIIFNKK